MLTYATTLRDWGVNFEPEELLVSKRTSASSGVDSPSINTLCLHSGDKVRDLNLEAAYNPGVQLGHLLNCCAKPDLSDVSDGAYQRAMDLALLSTSFDYLESKVDLSHIWYSHLCEAILQSRRLLLAVERAGVNIPDAIREYSRSWVKQKGMTPVEYINKEFFGGSLNLGAPEVYISIPNWIPEDAWKIFGTFIETFGDKVLKLPCVASAVTELKNTQLSGGIFPADFFCATPAWKVRVRRAAALPSQFDAKTPEFEENFRVFLQEMSFEDAFSAALALASS